MKILRNLMIAGMIGMASLISIKKTKAEDTIKKFVAEATYTIDNNILKIRPFDYMLPSEVQRFDLSFGKKIKDFSLSGYWMFDNKDNTWIGTRLDYGKKTLDDKLRWNIQLKCLRGLGKTKDKYYFIPTLDYKISRFNAGIMGYGVKSSGRDAYFYIGPLISTNLTKHISMMGAYGSDTLHKSDFIYWKTDFKF